jgi:hypothetical protein
MDEVYFIPTVICHRSVGSVILFVTLFALDSKTAGSDLFGADGPARGVSAPRLAQLSRSRVELVIYLILHLTLCYQLRCWATRCRSALKVPLLRNTSQ